MDLLALPAYIRAQTGLSYSLKQAPGRLRMAFTTVDLVLAAQVTAVESDVLISLLTGEGDDEEMEAERVCRSHEAVVTFLKEYL